MSNIFYGQWNPPVDAVLFHNFFPEGTPPGVLVECGAGDGLTESCGKFFEGRGWTCVNIEPDIDLFYQVEDRRKPPLNINLNYALSNHSSEHGVTFIKGPRPENTTVSPCKTWDEMADEVGLETVDLFILDVEGHELAVIDGMARSSVLPKVICAEYPWPTTRLEPMTAKLAELNYHLWMVSFNNAFFSRDPRPRGALFGETRIYAMGELG